MRVIEEEYKFEEPMQNRVFTKDEIRQIVSPIAKSRNIDRVFLFGSYARNEATDQSDLDFCIDAPKIKSIFTISGIRKDLSEAFGKEIDLITISSLKYNQDTAFVDTVNREKELIYE